MTVCFTNGSYDQLSVVFESIMVGFAVKQTEGQACSRGGDKWLTKSIGVKLYLDFRAICSIQFVPIKEKKKN